ncbi:hypothetical protein [Prevotella sp. HUN102]|uniref:hypothetical protein n=1 Tax=Prevotella sp. HUN102 TaxID=1392486 RepID=UPI00048EC67C|nr:hypothetical protein [Prevotella sp. HUN102]
MKFKVFALSLCCLIGLGQADAQTGKYASENLNEIRIGYSDGLTLGTASSWGMGISDALTGTKHTDERCSGVMGIGYRRHVRRCRLGVDLGFATASAKWIDNTKDALPEVEKTQLNFLVMPVAEMVYYKGGLIEIYGSLAAGVDITSFSKKGLTDAGRKRAKTERSNSAEFAFQVNPVAMRVGNDRIGGVLEAGVGYKGFVTAGVSVRL